MVFRLKLGKSITFDEKSIKLIQEYMQNAHISNFSLAVNEMVQGFNSYVKEAEKWRKIALTVQGKDHLI